MHRPRRDRSVWRSIDSHGSRQGNRSLRARNIAAASVSTDTDNSRPVVVVAAGNQQLPELPNGVMVARDLFPNAGPLAGLLTGLRCLRDQLPMRWPELMIWASTCDAPFVNASVIRHLQQRLAESAACPLVAVTHEGKQNPFVAVYRSSLLQSMEAQFEAGERKAQALLQHPHAILIDSGELAAIAPEFLFLRNINDNQQLAEARMRLDIPHNN